VGQGVITNATEAALTTHIVHALVACVLFAEQQDEDEFHSSLKRPFSQFCHAFFPRIFVENVGFSSMLSPVQ